jgi:hypothetical protein
MSPTQRIVVGAIITFVSFVPAGVDLYGRMQGANAQAQEQATKAEAEQVKDEAIADQVKEGDRQIRETDAQLAMKERLSAIYAKRGLTFVDPEISDNAAVRQFGTAQLMKDGTEIVDIKGKRAVVVNGKAHIVKGRK